MENGTSVQSVFIIRNLLRGEKAALSDWESKTLCA